MTKPKRTLENRGREDNATYDVASDVLDFIPIVGGLNRFARGEYKEGLINLGLDALGPIKYIAKGAKGVRLLANAGRIGQNMSKAKKYANTSARIANRMEQASLNGKLTKEAIEQGSKNMAKLDAKAEKAQRAVKRGLKTTGVAVAPGIVGKTAIHNDTNFRIGLAGGVQSAMDAPDTKTAVLQAISGTFENFGDKNSDPGDAFLLDDKEQEKFMNRLGYFKTTDDDGIKKIGKAAKALKDFRGNNKINIYQIGEDVISRDSVVPVDRDSFSMGFIKDGRYSLIHAGAYPTVYYRHINPNKNEYYYRDIDLNDYGNHNNTAGLQYGAIQHLADLYDKVGNPFIQKTGLQPMVSINDKEPFLRKQQRNGGSIHIASSKRGTFTAAATKHGMGVQEFANKVLRNKQNYSPAMIKKANFARNASKWN